MDALIGLTLDTTNTAGGTSTGASATENELPFDEVLVGEMEQVQNLVEAIPLNTELAENLQKNADLADEKSESVDEPTVDKSDKTLDESVSLLLGAHQQVTVKVATETVIAPPTNSSITTFQLSAENNTSATDEDGDGNTSMPIGNALPTTEKRLTRNAENMKLMAQRGEQDEFNTQNDVNDIPAPLMNDDDRRREASSVLATAVAAMTNDENDATSPVKTPSNEPKNKDVSATIAQPASSGLELSSFKWALQNHHNKAEASIPAITPNANTTPALNAVHHDPSVLTAQSGDVTKWLNNDDKRSTARSDVTASTLNTNPADSKTNDVNLPQALRFSLTNPRFNDVLSNQVLWQAKQGISQADIHLNPAELGPITVRLTQNGQETSVQFVVSHPSTKEQLEQAMPRLREVMQSGGLQLTNVDVQDGRKHPQQHNNETPQAFFARTSNPTISSAVSSSLAAPMTSQAEGIIDFYA